MDGDDSESANSSGVSILELLSCEMEYKTEISELVSEFVLDDILMVGKSGGGKAKSGIIGIGVWRLVGWEFERCRDPFFFSVVGSSWTKKMIILRLKSGDMGFYHLVNNVSLYVVMDISIYLV